MSQKPNIELSKSKLRQVVVQDHKKHGKKLITNADIQKGTQYADVFAQQGYLRLESCRFM